MLVLGIWLVVVGYAVAFGGVMRVRGCTYSLKDTLTGTPIATSCDDGSGSSGSGLTIGKPGAASASPGSTIIRTPWGQTFTIDSNLLRGNAEDLCSISFTTQAYAQPALAPVIAAVKLAQSRACGGHGGGLGPGIPMGMGLGS